MDRIDVILVNERGEEIGTAEKLRAHREALLHRGFSIFIFNAQGELLIAKRAEGKYHSGGLWANACCGHPLPGESLAAATRRRLREEMGMDCALHEVFHFIYHEPVEPGIWEHEDDYVLVGRSDATPIPDPAETSDWKWIALPALQEDVRKNPHQYAVWLRIILRDHLSQLNDR